MKFDELPKEVQLFIISTGMLIDTIDLMEEDDALDDNVKKRLSNCKEKYSDMTKVLF